MVEEVAENSASAFRLTRIRKDGGGRLSKLLRLDASGKVEAESSATLRSGWCSVVDCSSLPALASTIEGLGSDEALILGTPKQEFRGEAKVVLAKEYEALHGQKLNAEGRTVLARTKGQFQFASGAGAMLIDFDVKGMSAEQVARLEQAGGAWNVLASIFPALAGCGRVYRASTSSGLYHSETGEAFEKAGGGHWYVLVKNQADVPRALQAMSERLWAEGWGWHLISKAGQQLERSLVDKSVGSPERLVFEGAAQVEYPLAQEARRCEVVEGPPLDTEAAFQSSNDQHAQYLWAANAALKATAAEAEVIKRGFIEESVVWLMEQGVPEDEAHEVARLTLRDKTPVLMSEWILHPDSGKPITVEDVLNNPRDWHMETFADPNEPDYGRCKAKLYWNRGRGVGLHSLAHGLSRFYLLSRSPASMCNRIRKVAARHDGCVEEDALRKLVGEVAQQEIEHWDAEGVAEVVAALASASGVKPWRIRRKVQQIRAQTIADRRAAARPNDNRKQAGR